MTIYRTADSPFYSVQYSDGGGQHRYSLGTTNKHQAIKLAKVKDAELVLGKLVSPQKVLGIQEAVDQFLKDHQRRGTKERSIAVYRGDLESVLAYAKNRGHHRLDQLTASFLNAYHDELAGDGMQKLMPKKSKRGRPRKKNQPRTLRRKLKTVRQLIRWAMRHGLLQEDPARGYSLPKRLKTQAYCWSAEEAQSVCQAADAEYVQPFNFLRMTGLRADELCWLLKTDFDAARHCIHVRSKDCPQTGVPWSPKHGNERTIPLGGAAFQIALDAHTASPGPWLFWAADTKGRQKGHYTVQRLWRAVMRAKAAAGVTRGTTHTFRHVFCSMLANCKPAIPPMQVMKIMGHGSMEIVMMYYHVADEELLRSLEAVNWNPSPPPVPAPETTPPQN